MSLPQILVASIETAVNQYIALDPEALAYFEDLEGKVIAINITGIAENLYLFPGFDGIMIFNEFDGEADTTLTGTPIALAKLGMASNAAPILFSGEVVISGDTRLGNQFKKILSKINIDWEEIISQYTGDIVAHQLGNVTRNFSKWFSRSKNSLQMDVAEYLQEEQHFVPANAEIEKFVRDVDNVRNSVERLEAKINRLLQK